jgi:hypothetical protein
MPPLQPLAATRAAQMDAMDPEASPPGSGISGSWVFEPASGWTDQESATFEVRTGHLNSVSICRLGGLVGGSLCGRQD